jgi:cysteine desulfurase / selenocysteine lyase
LNDVPALARWAHDRGAVLVVDGAQAAPHRPVDVQALGCDFYAISGHKMCGPGAGALWGRAELLERMEPFLTGGEMISSVSLERTTWNEIPWKFEAGTPAIAECIGLGAAVDYLQSIGMQAIEAHEQVLTRYGHDVLRSISGVTLFGPPPERRAGILTFNVADLHPHDVAQVLDGDAICVRAGHHCAQPVVDHFGVSATTRASVYLYNTTEDLDRLGEGIERVKRTFGV